MSTSTTPQPVIRQIVEAMRTLAGPHPGLPGPALRRARKSGRATPAQSPAERGTALDCRRESGRRFASSRIFSGVG